ncbi:hypothetical protein [Streptomyces sp. 16-176A]|uniref:hypothetical protein n=1 Tax=unclassified Streptomyces TaxID=2593676 RepID=UPI0013B73815|nr:hypothetical protein [Streptomyces sp. SID89]
MPAAPADRADEPPSSARQQFADRAHALHWLRENADALLDFEILAERERAGL